MAWPPVIPPASRANATPILDTHPADHNAVSAALTELVGTAWTTFPFAAPWTHFGSGYQNFQYRKIGDVVQLRGVTTRSSAAAVPQTIGTMPAGFRPPAKTIVAASTGLVFVEVTVETTGVVAVTGVGTGTQITFVAWAGVAGWSVTA